MKTINILILVVLFANCAINTMPVPTTKTTTTTTNIQEKMYEAQKKIADKLKELL